jgi:hypothetical protein
MKKLLLILVTCHLSLVTLRAAGPTPLQNGSLTGASEIKSGTFNIRTGVTWTADAGSTINLSAGTVTFALNQIAWTAVSKTGATFVASGASHAAGIVPDPGSTAGTTKFLREDATFAVPPGVTAPFVASGASHASGLVPDPGSTAGTTKFLREDATFALPNYPSIASTTAPLKGDGAGNAVGGNPSTLSFATTAVSASAIDWATAQSFSKTLSANTTFTFSNATDGEVIIVAVTNTASNWTVTWPSVTWSGGSAPVQSTGANTDVYTFAKIGTTIYGSAVQASNSVARSQLPNAVSVRAYNSAAIALTSAATTTLTFDSERWDSDASHSTSSNTSRLTCQVAGKYDVQGNVEFAANSTGTRMVRILLNGATQLAKQLLSNTAADPTAVTVVTTADLAVGDYVELQAYQSSGGSLNVAATAQYSPEFMMTWVGK